MIDSPRGKSDAGGIRAYGMTSEASQMRRLNRKSIWEQSSAFWVGAGLIAEAPVVLALSSIDENRRAAAFDYALERPAIIVLVIVVVLILPVLVGWAAHRLGLGDWR
jgi:hypothetical protein